MKKIVLLAAALCINSMVSNAQCNWYDGQDNRYSFDPGRGVTNWNDHYGYAIYTKDLNTCGAFFGDRMNTLSRCINLDLYARMYADVSVKIAEYGNSFAGWRNAPNNTLPNDGGCGIIDWTAHFNYVKGNGYFNTADLVKNRMFFLVNIPRDSYAKMYADVSVIIARYGVGMPNVAMPASGQMQTTTTTTTQANPNNVNINMNIGGLGLGMNVNVNDPGYQQETVTQQTTTTTTTTGVYQQPVIVAPAPTPAPVVVQQGPCALPSSDYAQVESAIKSKPFAETKMSTAQLAIKGKCLSINQIRSLANLFAFPEDRLNFLKYAYDYTNDTSNYYTLSNTLNFDSDVESFNDFLSNRR